MGLAEEVAALQKRRHQRDLAMYAFFGAAKAIAEGKYDQQFPGFALRSLQELVANTEAEIAAIDAAYPTAEAA